MGFWNFIWMAFVTFAFIAYLFLLFGIVKDIFRQDKGGWWKAVWFFFLLFVPFLTALIYLVLYSADMAARDVQEISAAQQAAQQYIRQAAGHSPASEIATAAQLLKDGTITEAEYAAIKARVLAA